jgi:hypothetical protein
MRCAKNLINSITPPMNDKINPQIFSVLGVNMHIGTTSNEIWMEFSRIIRSRPSQSPDESRNIGNSLLAGSAT